MAEHRFFIDQPLRAGASIELARDRAQYIGRVLRRRAGDRIVCFSGDGAEFSCEVTNEDLRSFTISVVEETGRSSPNPLRLHLALALVKGQAMDQAVQHATELGATDIWIVTSARSNVQLRDRRLENKLAHWARITQSSAEQCGARFLPALHEMRSLEALLDETDAAPVAFDPRGDPFPRTLQRASRLLLIGPEGGWDRQELSSFRARAIPVYRCGELTLRAQTAPGVALALVQQAQGWGSDGEGA